MTAARDALVVGGGIGGLCAAVALRRQGIAVDLVERAPDCTVYGVGIIQPNNTLRALDQIGLADACVAAGAGFPGWRIHDGGGIQIAEAPASARAAAAYPPINGIRRPVFHAILDRAARESGTTISFGTTVDRIDDHGERVHVRLSDGRQSSYDCVIGCDGIYSPTRRHLFGDAPDPAFTGQGVWRYNLPRPSDATWGEIFVGPNSKAGTVPMSPTQMYLLLVTYEPTNPVFLPGALADEMRARMEAYSGRPGAYRDQIVDPAQVVYRPMESLMLPAPWHRGRVIVIGDAAHAATPHLAQGAAMAIEDAVLLAELLGTRTGVEDAYRELVERRHARTRFVVDTSHQLAAWEIAEWTGAPDASARPAELLQQASLALLEDY